MNDTATIATNGREVERNARGQFVLGHSGRGGRPRGSRAKLGEAFLDDLRDTWEQYGPQALERCAKEEPAQFCRIVAGLMPKEITAEVSMFADAQSFAEAFQLAVETIGGDPAAAVQRLRRSNPRLLDLAALPADD